MISYLFNNNKRIDKNKIFSILKKEYCIDLIVHNKNNTLLGNENILVDIDSKYISVLLYNETLNIKPLKKYIWEKNYGEHK